MKKEIEKIVIEDLSRHDKSSISDIKLISYDDRTYNFEIRGNKFTSSTFAVLQSKLSRVNYIADFWINAIDKKVLIIYLTVVEKRGLLIDNHLHTPVLDVLNHHHLS